MERGRRILLRQNTHQKVISFHFPLSTFHSYTLLLLLDLHLREPTLVEGDADIQAERILGDEVIR